MKLKINVEKYLGIKKDFTVDSNSGNSHKVYSMQAKIAHVLVLPQEVQKMREEKDFAGMADAYDKLADSIVSSENFLCELLNLTKNQAAKLNELEEFTLYGCVQSVISQYENEQIKALVKDDENTD